MSNEVVALNVQGLTAGYGGPPIIDQVSITARRGAITAIVGPNGAGKSTLLKAVAGLIRSTAGKVLVEGKEVTGQPPERLVRRGIAYIPQVANVFPDLKVSAHRHASTLSGGQRTMLALARGLMIDPAILILDEPSAGLAPRFQGLIWERIEQIRSTNVAVLIVEQNTRETLRHAQWAYVMVLGQNRLEGTGRELLENDEVVDLYVGRLT